MGNKNGKHHKKKDQKLLTEVFRYKINFQLN
jgi:hypothetical protein